jgi:hypothetical protein
MGMTTDEINQGSLFRHVFSYASIPNEQRDLYTKVGSKIGKNGWTIPSNMPENIPLVINKENWDEREIDTFFSEFFSKNDYANTIEMVTNIHESLPEEYKQTFDQLRKCLNSKLYIASILTLICLLEGVCQDLEDKKEVNINQLVHRRRNKASEKPEIEIPPTIFCHISAIQKCLSAFYDSVDFENILTVPQRNRHVLVHGRKLQNVTKNDCIRLLSCIDAILHVDFFLYNTSSGDM